MTPRTRILCVDDHPVVRAGLRAMIEATPNLEVVGEAATAALALHAAARLGPDLLVIDVRLPDGDGIDTAATLRRASPDLKIVVLSTFAGDETVHRALEAGAHGFVLKEHAEADLMTAISAVALGRRYLPSGVAEVLMLHGPRVVLTSREREVLAVMARGLQNKEIGRLLNITEATARTHVESVRTKFNSRDRQSTVLAAASRGFLVDLPAIVPPRPGSAPPP